MTFNDRKTRRVWCQGPHPTSVVVDQRYYLPARCIPLVRPEMDIIILPGDHPSMREAWNLYKNLLGLSDNQVVWTRGLRFSLDEEITEDPTVRAKLLRCMREISESRDVTGRESVSSGCSKDRHSCNWLFLPYSATPAFLQWARPFISLAQEKHSEMTISIFGESYDWMLEFGDKGLLHRHMSSLDVPSVVEAIDPTIPVPRGYVCKTIAELRAARSLLIDVPVCIKPVVVRQCKKEGNSSQPPTAVRLYVVKHPVHELCLVSDSCIATRHHVFITHDHVHGCFRCRNHLKPCIFFNH